MSENPTFDQIQSELDENDVVLFMKGSPMIPQCGFSAAVAHVLTTLQVKFKGVDVLQDALQFAKHKLNAPPFVAVCSGG